MFPHDYFHASYWHDTYFNEYTSTWTPVLSICLDMRLHMSISLQL